MYAQGMSLDDIAQGLGVNRVTVSRWKAADARRGVPWEALRDDYVQRDPRAVLAILDEAIASITERIQTALKAKQDITGLADALQKVDNVRARFAARFGNLSTVLGVFGDFAQFCSASRQVSDKDIGAVRRAVDAYLSDLKRRSA